MASSVSFSTPADGKVDESAIGVRDLGHDTFAVNLGFLKHNHKYQISFVVANRFGAVDLTCVDDPLQQSLHFRIADIERCADASGHKITAAMTAAKEKLMREKVTLTVIHDGADGAPSTGILKLEVNARVLGKDKGTPALKSGVKSVGIDRDLDDDSEQSDWQGFG